MRLQTTSHILMVRPANFASNPQTAESNAFQSKEQKHSEAEMRQQAMLEFDHFVEKLRAAGVNVIVANDSPEPAKPDAVFPNNWVTFHQEGYIVTYPMQAPLRRLERSEAIIKTVLEAGFKFNGERKNYEKYEAQNLFLEGTGSIIFDHQHKLAYACLSPRTDAELLEELCRYMGYRKVVFHSTDGNGQDIYHTNVMMALGETFVVICLDSVKDAREKSLLVASFAETDKEVIEITMEQMGRFAGNMLQVRNEKGETILVMSETAFQSLEPAQIAVIEQHTQILYSNIETIETYGGGSARCMMAEIFLPRVN